jgi:ABC-2 type transport system ATP-binding protein
MAKASSDDRGCAKIPDRRREDPPVIHTEKLSRRFGDRPAVDRLTFDVSAGEIVGLLGPNGAGKTTTIRMLAGMIAPSSGAATVDGLDPSTQPERVHEIVGLLTESPGFYDRLTAEQNLAYFARFYAGIDVDGALGRSLDRMGLSDRRRDRVGTFSKGMKQRLALARALLHGPRILFLDEPTAGLDPEAARDLRRFIVELSAEDRTVLLCTHNLTEAEEICERIAIFRTQLIALDTPAALREARFRPAVRVRLAGDTAGLVGPLRDLPFVRAVEPGPEEGDLTVRLDDVDRDRPGLVARIVEFGGSVLEVAEERKTLEDVYLDLVREEE